LRQKGNTDSGQRSEAALVLQGSAARLSARGDHREAQAGQGFGLPFGVWTTPHAGLQRQANDFLRSLAGRGIVRPKFIGTLLRDLLPAHPGHYGEILWVLTILDQWLRQRQPDYKVEI